MEQQLLLLQEENRALHERNNTLASNYDKLQGNFDELYKRLGVLEAQPQPSTENDEKDPEISSVDPVTATKQRLDEIAHMKNEALNASASIKDLRCVWYDVDSRISKNTKTIDDVQNGTRDLQQWTRMNSLLWRGLNDVPKKTYGLNFSRYMLKKIKSLLPAIADQVKLEDIDVSHPLPSDSKGKSCVIIRFVRRDIRNLVFYAKSALKRSKVTITEHLSKHNLWLLDEVRKMVSFRNTWTSQCVVFALVNNVRYAVKCEKDLDDIYYETRRTYNVRRQGGEQGQHRQDQEIADPQSKTTEHDLPPVKPLTEETPPSPDPAGAAPTLPTESV